MIILMFQSELAQVPFVTDDYGKLLGIAIASDYAKYAAVLKLDYYNSWILDNIPELR
jgi:hypothetical protein